MNMGDRTADHRSLLQVALPLACIGKPPLPAHPCVQCRLPCWWRCWALCCCRRCRRVAVPPPPPLWRAAAPQTTSPLWSVSSHVGDVGTVSPCSAGALPAAASPAGCLSAAAAHRLRRAARCAGDAPERRADGRPAASLATTQPLHSAPPPHLNGQPASAAGPGCGARARSCWRGLRRTHCARADPALQRCPRALGQHRATPQPSTPTSPSPSTPLTSLPPRPHPPPCVLPRFCRC